MGKVKYIRVSTSEQNIQRQNVNKANYSKIYIDRCSGSIEINERKYGEQLISDIISGGIKEVHVESIDRLGRNIIDILLVVELLNNNNVNLFVENIGMYSLAQNKPNPSFKMIVSVLGNVAEMERLNMLERQKQGIEIAKAKGIYKGRLYGTIMTKEDILIKYDKVVRELNRGESLRRTAALCGCSLGTVQKVKSLIT
ncbi:MAG: DNA invertase Pin-like site-specific DNA recombinase [Flavobacteriales bacterium]|jgi:DNA invertase Pin-like site-specific DNA recombinase